MKNTRKMWRRALDAALLGCLACAQPAVHRLASPALLRATEVPLPSRDPDRPADAVLWTLGYDMRTFDSTWEWLNEAVPDSPERARAVGMAGLTGIAELGRFDLIEPALGALEAAQVAFPEDARLPLWASYIRWIRAERGGAADDRTGAYDDLRASSREYPTFTLFGLTLAIAADAHASPELVQEARDAYDLVVSGTADLQFEDDARSRERLRRMGDWESAPYNLSGTQALIGDMHLRAGDVEAAQRAYYIALNGNTSYRWPFRELVQSRLESAEELAESFQRGTPEVGLLGAGWRQADAARPAVEGFDGRVGNGSCTLCHTRLRERDRTGGREPERGWVRVRYDTPPAIRSPFPVFVALPEADTDATPVGLSIGQTSLEGWSEQLDDDTYEVLVPAPPGSWFIAGQLFGGELGEFSDSRFATYAAKWPLGLPRFVSVHAGQVTDLSGSPMRFTPEDD